VGEGGGGAPGDLIEFLRGWKVLLRKKAHHQRTDGVGSLQALFDLEATNQELKSDLRDLYIIGAKEVDINASRKAIIIHVSHPPPPPPSLYQKCAC